ncbi:uncharacterized protein LOC133299173 [Gastrolobium bilobum]|uniref:uncharacterized protein LOC133299173 n=1 Tax=Gastrolobium bilobum TaxID=150636 RepID=UPI002AB1462A|nr:uncharacterized protein LOC133299173 [Gastrolobium bilobum]
MEEASDFINEALTSARTSIKRTKSGDVISTEARMRETVKDFQSGPTAIPMQRSFAEVTGEENGVAGDSFPWLADEEAPDLDPLDPSLGEITKWGFQTILKEDGTVEIRSSREARVRMCQRWKNALIVKLLGKKIGVGFMKKRLEALWAKAGSITVADLGNEYFSVRFSNLEDLNLAITAGLWIILGHYLATRIWEPRFDPDKENIHKVAAWIRLPGIPQEYCEFPFLNHLGTVLGKVLKVDRTTSTGDSALCSYGHSSDSCPEFAKPGPPAGHETELAQPVEVPGPQGIGSWTIVQRRKKGNQNFQKEDSSNTRNFGEDISNKSNTLRTESTTRRVPNPQEVVQEKIPKVGTSVLKKNKENEAAKSSKQGLRLSMEFTAVKPTSSSGPVQPAKKVSTKTSAGKGKGSGNPKALVVVHKKNISSNSTPNSLHPSPVKLKSKLWSDMVMEEELAQQEDRAKLNCKFSSAVGLGCEDSMEIPVPPDIFLNAESKKGVSQSGMEVDSCLCNDSGNLILVDRVIICDKVMTETCNQCAAKKQFKSTFCRFCRKHKVGLAAILEPRVSGIKASSIIRRLGFTNHFVVDAHGFAGGIWVVWNNNDVKLSLLGKHDQFIYCWVEFPGLKGFFWTAVYASPQEEKRLQLWEDLKHIGRNMNEAWILSGDFNEIMMASEKRGGGLVDVNRCNRFANTLSACGVLDLGGDGNRFTWRAPKFSHLDRVFKRLDRAAANEGWRTEFEDADVLVLPRLFSDHCPILGLEQECLWIHSVKEEQGNSRLEGIQRAIDSSNSIQLEKLEAVLRDELAVILDQEEQIWFQKSRTHWIKGGDRNTSYYHTSTVIRRKLNKIIKLQDGNGHWVSGERELIALVRDFFQNLFKASAEEPS